MFFMNTKIGIFDSGIGGVTVLKECIRLNPNYEYLYYSDSIHNPYGDKIQDTIIFYCDDIVKFFVHHGCKIIIIACNTASAMASSYLRDKYPDLHFIAIEPAIKLCYDSNTNGTLIMATKGTMDSQKFHELYSQYHRDGYYLISCVGLADLIENGSVDEIESYLVKYLSVYKGKVSNVVLGCTHYPLIKKQIRDVLGDVCFFDGAVGVAMQLKRIIFENGYISSGKGIVSFYDSTGNTKKRERFYQLLNSDVIIYKEVL